MGALTGFPLCTSIFPALRYDANAEPSFEHGEEGDEGDEDDPGHARRLPRRLDALRRVRHPRFK